MLISRSNRNLKWYAGKFSILVVKFEKTHKSMLKGPFGPFVILVLLLLLCLILSADDGWMTVDYIWAVTLEHDRFIARFETTDDVFWKTVVSSQFMKAREGYNFRDTETAYPRKERSIWNKNHGPKLKVFLHLVFVASLIF